MVCPRDGDTPAAATVTPAGLRRAGPFTHGFLTTAKWMAGGIIIVIGLVILWQVAGYLWSVVFPILLALLLASILWPVNRVLRRALPHALAALLTLLTLLAALFGLTAWIIPSLLTESAALAMQFRQFLATLTAALTGPPLHLENVNLNALVDEGVSQLRDNTAQIITGITSGITTSLGLVFSGVVTLLLVLVFVFFCLKDGDKFLPWLAHWMAPRTYAHVSKVSARAWHTLSGYVSAQAAVALVDAIFIGLGLWLLHIPLALPLTVLVFFAAFIPIVGAVGTGLLAALVALIAGGWVTALAVLGLVILVQQLESNLLQPVLVGRALKIHPAVVLASVTVGGTLFGITGAFLAVPVVGVGIVVLQYLRDHSFSRRHFAGPGRDAPGADTDAAAGPDRDDPAGSDRDALAADTGAAVDGSQ